MARSLGNLTLDLVTRLGGWTKGFTEAERIADRTSREIAAKQKARAKEVEAAWASVKNVGLAIGAAVTAAIGSFAALDAVAGTVAKFQDMSEVMGDTAEAIAGLRTASDLSGASLESIQSASVRLTATLAKTDDEAKGAGAALKALNLPLEEFKRLSPVAQFEAVAKALGDFEDGAEKTAVAVALFGKAGAELLPFLRALNEEGGRNVILTQQQIKAADDFADATAKLKSDIAQLGQSIFVDLLPPFQALVDELNRADKQLRLFSVAGEVMKTVFETIVVLGANVIYVFKQVGNEIGGIAAQIAALARLDLKGFTAISDAMKEDAARARRELDRFEQSVLRPITYSADDQSGAEARRLGLVRPRLDTSGLMTPDKKANQARIRDASLTAEQIARLQLQAEEEFQRESAEAWDIYTRMQIEQSKTRADAEKAMWQQIFDEIDAEQERAIEDGKALLAMGKQVDDFGKRMAENVQDLLGQGLYDMANGSFKNIAKSFGDMILRMVAQAQAANIARALFGTDSQGALSGNWASALGTWFSGFFGGARAGGGPVRGGSAYMVGERGPELFVPQMGGSIIPNHELSAAGPMRVEVNNYGSDEVRTRQGPDGRAIIDIVRRESVRSVAADTSAGGVTARATAGRFGVNNGATLNRRRG